MRSARTVSRWPWGWRESMVPRKWASHWERSSRLGTKALSERMPCLTALRLAMALPRGVAGPRLAMGHLGMADWIDVSTCFLVRQEGEFVWQKWVVGLRDYSRIALPTVRQGRRRRELRLRTDDAHNRRALGGSLGRSRGDVQSIGRC